MMVAAHEVARVVLPLASGTPSRSAAPPHALLQGLIQQEASVERYIEIPQVGVLPVCRWVGG